MAQNTVFYSDFLLFVAAMLAAGAVSLLVRGFRGRRIDDHPLCRKCGFDLTGRVEGSDRCPECGIDVTAAGAVQIGHKRRWAGAIVGGLALLLLAGVAATPPVLSRVSQFSVQQYKPMWLLRRDAESPNVATRNTAMIEIMRRVNSNGLTDGNLKDLAVFGLAVQGDPSKPWHKIWASIVQIAYGKQLLTRDQWALFARQAVKIELLIRPRVRRGDPVIIGLRKSAPRGGDNLSLVLAYDSRDRTISVNDIPMPNEKNGSYSSGRSGIGGSGTSTSFEQIDVTELLDRLPDGKCTLRIRSLLKVRESWGEEAAEMTRIDSDLTGTFDLRPASEPAVTVQMDESPRVDVERAIKVDELRVPAGNDPHVGTIVEIGGPPVGLGFKVVGRAGGKEWKFGSFACPAATTSHSWSLGASVDDLPTDVNAMDVVFTPDTETAARSLNTFDIWGHEVIFKGVKIVREKPASRPTTYP
jgi:hypothetical protein